MEGEHQLLVNGGFGSEREGLKQAGTVSRLEPKKMRASAEEEGFNSNQA
jgi:hypothetical protein